MASETYVPYCGSPPVHGGATWNFDPALILGILALAGFHLWRQRGAERNRLALGAAGYAVAFLAFVSPLCNLSIALFSARVGQHVILTLIAAPLIAWLLPRRAAPAQAAGALLAAALFAGFLWAWHMPMPYEATLRSDVTYWAMHLSLFASAVWLWRTLMNVGFSSGVGFVTGVVSGFQMSLLGAVLAFAPQALFPFHFSTTLAWGLSPLQDQQIGGMIMWVPAGLLLTGYAVVALGLHLRRLGGTEGGRSRLQPR